QDLNTKDRYIFLKRYIDGYSIDDIAKELKVTADYIYNRISRGKKKLQKLWKGSV
ncbi:TPA: RNA polymerase subunit sigma-24, partial [Bacillus toyonensis]|nr:RNA polymerase subunit sigma-24 [Bacillus toyonensis]